MSRRDDRCWLNDINHAAKTIVDEFNGVSYEDFNESLGLQSIAVRYMSVMGEASAKLSDQFRKKHNQIPWIEMIGMRNKLFHDYFEIDFEIVWNVIADEIPNIFPHLQDLENKLAKGNSIGY